MLPLSKKSFIKYKDHILQILAYALNLIFIMAAAYFLDLDEFGIFSYKFVIASIFAVGLKFGLDSVFQYFSQRVNFRGLSEIILTILVLILATSALICSFIGYPEIIIYVIAALIAIDEIFYSIKRVEGKAAEFLMLRNILIVTRIISICFYNSDHYSILSVYCYSTLPSIIFFLVQVLKKYKSEKMIMKEGLSQKGSFQDIANFSLKTTFSNLMGVLSVKIDIIILAFFVSYSQLGIYEIGARWGFIAMIPITLFSVINAPIISKLGKRKRKKHLLVYFNDSRRKVFFTTTIYFLALILVRLILAIFDINWEYNPLDIALILATGFTFSSYFGPTGTAIVMLGFPGRHLVRIFISLMINILLNLLLIQYIGIYGAAIAVSSVLVISSIMSQILFQNTLKAIFKESHE